MEKEKTTSIIVKILCVLLSVALWLYITKTENPNITYNVRNIPVNFTNIDVLESKNLFIEHSDSYTVDIKVEGKTSDPKVTKDDFNLYVDLYEYALKEGVNKLPIKVESSPTNINILNNGIPWLQVNIDSLVEVTVPVKISVIEKEKSDKFLKEVITDPKEMKIYGPSRKVKQVKHVLGKFDVSKSSELKTAIIEVKPVNALNDLVNDIKLEMNTVNVALGVNTIKSLPIKVITKGNSPAAYKISKTEVNPSIIKIMGDEKIINQLQYIETRAIDISHLKETAVLKKISLVLPQGLETLESNTEVDVTIFIENQNVEKQLTSVIKIKDPEKYPETDYNVVLNTKEISYKVSGINNDINRLEDKDIKVYVELKGLAVGFDGNVPVKILLPTGITLVSQDPKEVKLTITKKQ